MCTSKYKIFYHLLQNVFAGGGWNEDCLVTVDISGEAQQREEECIRTCNLYMGARAFSDQAPLLWNQFQG